MIPSYPDGSIGEMRDEIRALVEELPPGDDLEAWHREAALAWLAGTEDIFRRAKPRTPSPHLVAYFLLRDPADGAVLLVDHRLAGMWLPSGGHVAPGEHPAGTVRRELREELGVAGLRAAVRRAPGVPDRHRDGRPAGAAAHRREPLVRAVRPP